MVKVTKPIQDGKCAVSLFDEFYSI